MLTTKNFPKNK